MHNIIDVRGGGTFGGFLLHNIIDVKSEVTPVGGFLLHNVIKVKSEITSFGVFLLHNTIDVKSEVTSFSGFLLHMLKFTSAACATETLRERHFRLLFRQEVGGGGAERSVSAVWDLFRIARALDSLLLWQ